MRNRIEQGRRRLSRVRLPSALRRAAAAGVPALIAAFGVAVAATWPAEDRPSKIKASPSGLSVEALVASYDPALRALVLRHDPMGHGLTRLGLTPGWDSVSLGGKPTLDLGASGREAQRLNAIMPLDAGALRPARPFVFNPATDADRARAIRCLTQAVYFEAALESTLGQEAVAQVVLNRVRDPNYPSSICGVVFQGAERNTGCQFSFTCDGALAQGPVRWAWQRAQTVALRALAGHVAQRVGTATHYHADYVHPWWSPTLAKIDQIGAHIFYRWKGSYGETAAFRQAYARREPVIDEARFARPRVPTPTDVALTEPAMAEAVDARTVEVDGQTRVVGVVSLGGRRQPTAEEIATINARLQAFEEPEPPTPQAEPASVPGAVPMAVEEVGRPR